MTLRVSKHATTLFPLVSSYYATTATVHIHPRKFTQTIVLSDGSTFRLPSISPERPTVNLNFDSLNHPSWNPQLRSNKQLLDEQGSVSKFTRRFGAEWTAAMDSGSAANNVSMTSPEKDATSAHSNNNQRSIWHAVQSDPVATTIRPGKLETLALAGPPSLVKAKPAKASGAVSKEKKAAASSSGSGASSGKSSSDAKKPEQQAKKK